MRANESWRDVPGLEYFQASSLGRVRVLPYPQVQPHGGIRFREVSPTYGYKDGKRLIFRAKGQTWKIHQLVCKAFHGEPQDGQVCMHLDENGFNNIPDNLKWGTQKENLNFPGFINYCKSRTGDNSPIRKGKLHAK